MLPEYGNHLSGTDVRHLAAAQFLQSFGLVGILHGKLSA